MEIIISFFIIHYFSSLFFQSFYLHRYCAHGMFTMGPKVERLVHFLTFITQGSSYLNPTAYGIMHKAHHSYSDTEQDPHSPHHSNSLFSMMMRTAREYLSILEGDHVFNKRFKVEGRSWKSLENIGDSWKTRVAFGVGYFSIYFFFAPSPVWFLLLPIHFLMGPIHGAIVNWCGHKYGYRNHELGDLSRNTLPFDFLAMGELFQNNHHRFPNQPNFATRWFEWDPTYSIMRVLNRLKLIRMKSLSTQTSELNAKLA